MSTISKVPITRKALRDWAGPRVFRDGLALFENRVVRDAVYDHPFIQGELAYGQNRGVNCRFELLTDGSVANHCPCRDNRERGIICAHVVALGMELVKRKTDPERDRKALEEKRRAARLESIDESSYIQRVPSGTPGAAPANLRIELESDWMDTCREGWVSIRCRALYGRSDKMLDQVPKNEPLAFSRQDENILFVLEDISEGPARGNLDLSIPDFINLLNLHQGKPLFGANNEETVTVNAVKMSSVLRMDMDRENGELILMVHTELPFMDPKSFPIYVIARRAGWVYDAHHFWPLENLLPTPLQSIYEKPICVARPSIPRFLHSELPLIRDHIRVDTEITEDLFVIEPAEPDFRLNVRGSPASLAATLYAEYSGITLVAGKPDAEGQFALPDPEDLLRYTVRNLKREDEALEQLAETGLSGERGDELTSVIGTREVLNFLGSQITRLRRLGWKVELQGRVEPYMETLDFATPVVRIKDEPASNWFEVDFEFENLQGESLSEADIQRALLKGEAFIEKQGRTILLDADAINTARDVFADCASGEGSKAGAFRMNSIYSAYVKSSLDSLDGIDVEATPDWMSRAQRQNRGHALEPVPLLGNMQSTLRSYQKDGVYWLRFLENNFLCGILADEMGLGKTLQTLSWVDLNRQHPEAADRPALIVCPTSLVENWAEEAGRFVPDMKTLMITGPDRHASWPAIERADLVITSYALMRRDIERYLEIHFSAIVLDEAQHIKNRSTQNAVAAKRLKGSHRLVLTGTPIENTVSDLWSIMDFLMPGYLGSHQAFRENYEGRIGQGGPDSEVAQRKLRRKLHPFLLRRLKKEVAKDLPPKIERVASCTLSKDQQLMYKQLLDSSRRKISNMVNRDGFNRSRMEILKTLMRLRQTCCHLELLKLPDLASKRPSAKMDLFFELMDEAVDAGHRVLVFSQFTSMLAILRRELESRNLQYCYLDGSTKDRLTVVRNFNMNREIPAFLISLKAGGTGLNLTGADMVIHFDPWWNPAVEDQATDRAYRIGQKRTVYSVKLITKGTVEEKVLAMQKRKKDIINATLARDEEVMGKLSWEDVQELLDI